MVRWSLVIAAATVIYPGAGLAILKRRAVLLSRLAVARGWVSRWLARGPHRLLQNEIEHNPKLLGFVVWPFMHAGWPVERRLHALSEHLRVVDEALPWLALGEDESREVLSLGHLVPGLRLELDRAAWFLREGPLVLNLFLGEHRLKSLAFSLAREDGDLVAYLGGFQGSNRPRVLETYRGLTKALHGLRPRDFLVKMFQLFARAIGVTRILGVADDYRHHRHPFFGRRITAKLFLNYDEIWQENGGVRLSSGFFLLPAAPAEKRLDQVPPRKRAMYKRRYAMMAELDRALRARFPPPCGSPEPREHGAVALRDAAPRAQSEDPG